MPNKVYLNVTDSRNLIFNETGDLKMVERTKFQENENWPSPVAKSDILKSESMEQGFAQEQARRQ